MKLIIGLISIPLLIGAGLFTAGTIVLVAELAPVLLPAAVLLILISVLRSR
jgi:hypothetical protein